MDSMGINKSGFDGILTGVPIISNHPSYLANGETFPTFWDYIFSIGIIKFKLLFQASIR